MYCAPHVNKLKNIFESALCAYRKNKSDDIHSVKYNLKCKYTRAFNNDKKSKDHERT